MLKFSHAGRKAASNGTVKAPSAHVNKANVAAAAAPVTVQASAHANSKYAMPPAYPVDPPIPAGSLSKPAKITSSFLQKCLLTDRTMTHASPL